MQFGNGCLHSKTLHSKVHEVGCQIPDKIRLKLTADHTYLCAQMGVKDKPLHLPFQPVHGAAEYTVFNRMMLVLNKGAIDFDKMALD